MPSCSFYYAIPTRYLRDKRRSIIIPIEAVLNEYNRADFDVTPLVIHDPEIADMEMIIRDIKEKSYSNLKLIQQQDGARILRKVEWNEPGAGPLIDLIFISLTILTYLK